MRISDWSSDVCSSDLPERRARLDRLQLLRVADQHDLGAGVGRMGQYALHLAGADHASLVDNENVARAEHIAPLGSEERRGGQESTVHVDIGGHRIFKNKTTHR